MDPISDRLQKEAPDENILSKLISGIFGKSKTTLFFDKDKPARTETIKTQPNIIDQVKALPEFISQRLGREQEFLSPVPEGSSLQPDVPQVPEPVEPEKPEQTPLIPRAEETTVQREDIVSNHFPADQINNALNVMAMESSGNTHANPTNKNGSKDYGLMQINDIHREVIKNNFGYTMEDMFDPEKNIEVAGFLYNQSLEQHGNGWLPWVAAKGLNLI